MVTATPCSNVRRLTGTRETALHVSRSAAKKSVVLMGAVGHAVNVRQALYVERMEPAIPVNLNATIRNVDLTDAGEVVASVMTTLSAV
jgi:hypothetical protein